MSKINEYGTEALTLENGDLFDIDKFINPTYDSQKVDWATIVTEMIAEDVFADNVLTTKGDVYTFDSDNQRLGVGTNGQVLTANSATATGLEWANPAGGGGTTINDTDLVLPVRSDATTFVDSLLRMTATTGELVTDSTAFIFKASGLSDNDSIRIVTEADGTLVYDGLTGGLFSVIDDKDNELWTASDVSGNPLGYIDADWNVRFGNPFARIIDGSYNNGTGTSLLRLGNADALRKGNISLDGLHYNTNITTLATAGTPNVDILYSITRMTSSGTGQVVGIEDGQEGQELTLIYEAEGAGTDTVLVQPLSSLGFTTLTFEDVGMGAVLIFSNSAWMVKSVNGATLS